jgi:hypothetical protein
MILEVVVNVLWYMCLCVMILGDERNAFMSMLFHGSSTEVIEFEVRVQDDGMEVDMDTQ